jgi:hypothetical protein
LKVASDKKFGQHRGFVYCLYIYAQLKIKLFVFVFHKQTTMAPFWYGDAMWNMECAMENADQIFCPKLLSTKRTFDLFFLISVT